MLTARWEGLIARLNTPTNDGRRLSLRHPKLLQMRDLPLPVLHLGHINLAGTLDVLSATRTEMEAMGLLDLDTFDPATRQLLEAGQRLGCGVDLLAGTTEHTCSRGVVTLQTWRLMGLTVYAADRQASACPGVGIRLSR